MRHLTSTAILVTLCLGSTGCGSTLYMGQHPSVGYEPVQTQMSEELRMSVRTVKVVPDDRTPTLHVSGDYGREVTGTGEGAADGAVFGAQLTGQMVAEDPRSAILVPFILPTAMITGAAVGATATKVEQQVQKFRERLTNELAAGNEQALPAKRLAEDLAGYLGSGPYVTPVTDNADGELAVTVTNIDIITREEDATIVTTVEATLRNSNGARLFSRTFTYGKQESLRNWTGDDGTAWRQYADDARRYLVAEIAADLFERVHVRHVLRPASTDTFTGSWEARLSTETPTLAWELFLLGGTPVADDLADADVTYELRVFDTHRLVYAAIDITDTSYEITRPFEGCRKLHWSVRPIYEVDGESRAGAWMNNETPFRKWRGSLFEKRPDDWTDSRDYYATLKTRCRT